MSVKAKEKLSGEKKETSNRRKWGQRRIGTNYIDSYI